jgi:hypothetical protein
MTCAICGGITDGTAIALPSGRARHADVMDCFFVILERNKTAADERSEPTGPCDGGCATNFGGDCDCGTDPQAPDLEPSWAESEVDKPVAFMPGIIPPVLRGEPLP